VTTSDTDDLRFDERFDRAVTVAIETGIWVGKNAARRGGRDARARAYFKALAEVFALYASSENWKTRVPRRELPRALAMTVGGHAAYLAEGKIPDPIKHCARRGNIVGPDEKRDIRRAVVYIVAVKRGFIRDKGPVKTVTDLYGCRDRKAVQRWVQKYRATVMDDELAVTPRLIRKQMKDAASRYSVSGRSRASVAKRDKKRSGK
jgi:hypothetical protein